MVKSIGFKWFDAKLRAEEAEICLEMFLEVDVHEEFG
jgi:hypothetical protein